MAEEEVKKEEEEKKEETGGSEEGVQNEEGQAGGETQGETGSGQPEGEELSPDDLMSMWEEALKEAGASPEGESSQETSQPASSEAAPESSAPSPSPSTQPAQFEEMTPEAKGTPPELDFILDIPLEISVEIGRTKMLIKDLLKLNQGSIIELEKFAGEPVEIYVNGKLMAKGEVIVVNDKFGVRITEIVSARERVRRLGASF